MEQEWLRAEGLGEAEQDQHDRNVLDGIAVDANGALEGGISARAQTDLRDAALARGPDRQHQQDDPVQPGVDRGDLEWHGPLPRPQQTVVSTEEGINAITTADALRGTRAACRSRGSPR